MKQNHHLEGGGLRDSILQILTKRKESLNIKQIAWELELKGGDYRQKIRLALESLIAEKLVKKNNSYKFKSIIKKTSILGVVDINKSGHGYVLTESFDEEVFVNKKNRLNSLNKDTVCIELIKGGISGRIEGVITKVLSRANKKFTGFIDDDGKNAFFIADNTKVGSDFFIPRESLNGAKNQSRVIVEFVDWPINAGCPFGKVIRIIGDTIDLNNEIETNIEVFNIRNSFSDQIELELGRVASKITTKELQGRKDFRDILTVTIDPIDAKDFDDAISVRKLKNNNIEIGVHIADVSHYVKSSSEIDKEAFLRAFSVYFPGTVVSMLPEKLSNNICSLKPHEDKLAFSVVLEISNLAQIKSSWIGKTIINSNKRFTYQEAELIIDRKSGKYSQELILLNNIAEQFRQKRVKEGAIEFNRADVSFELDQLGNPVKVFKKTPLKSHKLVEDFMLMANKIVAEKLSKLNRSIYRVHDWPDTQKIKDIAIYLNRNKAEIKLPNISQKNITKCIKKLFKLNHEDINSDSVESLILRSMAKAKYSTKNIGHYGLGFEKYTHFTSPIRRYSDLIVHRMLHAYLNGQKSHAKNLETQCAYLSSQERLYVNVERKTIKFIQLKLLEGCIGEKIRGYVSGVQKWGIYVELFNGRGEGLVPVKSLVDDKYYYDAESLSFISKKYKKKYILGQRVFVTIKSINLFKREMDLSF